MAKFYGAIGYEVPTEVEPGIWSGVVERTYSGDVIRHIDNVNSGNTINGDVALNSSISIIADPYAIENFYAIRYIKWHNGVWKVTNVEPQYPRLLLTIGGVYNGKQASTAK